MISGVSSQSISNVFNSTYDQYVAIISVDSGTTAADTDLTLRLRTTTDDSTADYRCRNIAINNAGATASYGSGNTLSEIYCIQIATANKTTQGIVNFFNPNKATATGITGQSISNNLGITFNCQKANTTQYTGFTILIGSGTATGSVQLYGVNK